MKPWAKFARGDCLEQLQRLPDDSVDLICTDPPYGISFMGRDWDKAVPPVAVWRECLRVLKPGAFCFVMSSPRQDCLARMIMNLEEAGFVTSFSCISWVYFSGFPKAQNLSKAADKRAGVARKIIGEGVPSGMNRHNASMAKAGYRPNEYQYGGNPITAPATEAAKQLNGAYAGCQLKPAQEPILVVMKPLQRKTYLDQALDNQKGCTWLDDCRIPIVTAADAKEVSQKNQHTNFGSGPRTHNVYGDITKADRDNYDPSKGRFPANVIVSDDALNDSVVRTSCRSTKQHNAYDGESSTGLLRGESNPSNQYDDSGSASRYFDLDAWWAERIGCLPEEVQRVFPNLMVPKPSKREKNAGLEGMPKRAKPQMGEFKDNPGRTTPKSSPTPRENHHPTVKSVKLMSYLITLGSRESDVVLDPYMGSGTTGVAAVGLDRNFLGCELDPEYVEIAKQRIKWIRQHGLEALSSTKQKSTPKPKPDKTAVNTSTGLWRNRG